MIELDELKNDDIKYVQAEDKIAHNKNLCERYPFLIPRNVWTGKIAEDYDYSYTMLDDMPDGWRIAFGVQMCEEIRDALLKTQEEDPNGGYEENYITTNYDSDKIIPYLEGYRVDQIKEKFGTLRWYSSGAPQSVHDIECKYDRISETICIDCGKPAKYLSIGWISPYCEDCAKHSFETSNKWNKEHNVTEADFSKMYEPIKYENDNLTNED